MNIRPSSTTLFMSKHSLEGDRVSIAMIEKNLAHDRTIINIAAPPEVLLDFNPQLNLPAFHSRETSIYFGDIILEYLNERHPHPPLYPNDPIVRSHFRLLLKRILSEWYPVMGKLINKDGKDKDKALTKQIQEILLTSNPLFENNSFFQNKEFTIIDCTLAPLFAWISIYKIPFPDNTEAIKKYSERVLKRPSVRYLFDKLPH